MLHNISEECRSQIAYWSADNPDTESLNKTSHMQHLQCLGRNFKQLLIICSPAVCGPGSVVSTATGYGLDGPEIESWWG